MRGSLSAAFAALWLALITLLALVVVAALLVIQNYRGVVEAGEARAMSAAQVVAAHIEWMMEASDQALQRIEEAVGAGPVVQSAGAIADIRQAVGNLPAGFQYSVYDETGRLRFSSIPEAVGVEVSDREYFKRLANGETLVISPQLEERLSGEQVFVVARRIARGDTFLGAASIAIPTKAMDEFWALLELGPLSTVSIVRNDGWVVARHPQLEHTMDLSQSQLFQVHLGDATSGVYSSSASPADGISRIVGFRVVQSWPLVATAGVERGEALAAFWTSLRAGLTIGVPLIGLLLAGAIWIFSLLRADSERRLALEQALNRNSFLLREIHHRVKNNLQAVAALVSMQPLSKESKEDMARRISAMVAVHEQIYEADQFDRLNMAPYAERLVSDVAAGFDDTVAIKVQAEALLVEPDQALSLGLILNEAITNAFKYAFAHRQDGKLSVMLKKEGSVGQLIVADNGPGFDANARKGMGSRLIRGLASQLDGDVRVEADSGTKITVTFPLS
ncbi:sensor histidine kinase [Neoaquamicrobium microcysteis]|nr:histidine kinase dimerization/phosphoacceptor domain -containing protein [Mesorhizobium microcysteis]